MCCPSSLVVQLHIDILKQTQEIDISGCSQGLLPSASFWLARLSGHHRRIPGQLLVRAIGDDRRERSVCCFTVRCLRTQVGGCLPRGRFHKMCETKQRGARSVYKAELRPPISLRSHTRLVRSLCLTWTEPVHSTVSCSFVPLREPASLQDRGGGGGGFATP